jgi:hypothetical protein
VKTSFGGTVSLMIKVVIFAFSIMRLIKMSRRDDPFVSEIKEGLDLLAEDAPKFEMENKDYTVGINLRFFKDFHY